MADGIWQKRDEQALENRVPYHQLLAIGHQLPAFPTLDLPRPTA